MDPSGPSLRSLLHDDCDSFVKPFKGPVSIPTASSVASIDEVEETVAEAEAASIAAAVFAAELAKVAASNVPQDVTDGLFSHYPPDEDGGDLGNNNDEVEDDIKVEVGDGDEDDDYLSDPENDLESMAIGVTKTTTTQTTTEAEAAAVAIAVVAAEVAKVASNVASASSRRGDEASSSSGSLVCDVGNSGNGSVDTIRKFNSTNFVSRPIPEVTKYNEYDNEEDINNEKKNNEKYDKRATCRKRKKVDDSIKTVVSRKKPLKKRSNNSTKNQRKVSSEIKIGNNNHKELKGDIPPSESAASNHGPLSSPLLSRIGSAPGSRTKPNIMTVYDDYNIADKRQRSMTKVVLSKVKVLKEAELAYEKAMIVQVEADEAMARASQNVLETELEENPDDEWNKLYSWLVSYKEKYGNVIFPRKSEIIASITDKILNSDDCANGNLDGSCTSNASDNIKEGCRDDVDGILSSKSSEEGGIMNIKKKEKENNDSTLMIHTLPTKIDRISKLVCATTAPGWSTKTPGSLSSSRDLMSESELAELHEWVKKMRTFSKKKLKMWQRQALDKIGFIWDYYDATWTDQFYKLKFFVKENGHSLVPASHLELGMWLSTQRKQYRLLKIGKPSHMTGERVQKLESIGIVWQVNNWMERFNDLNKFINENGHCNLPTDYHNKQLRSWATTQRSHYRFLCQGKQSHLTEERVQLLDSVGFSWKTREDWGTRFSELKTYHQQFGNCSVPRGYKIFPKLYRWINHQRLELRKFSEGLPSRLKNEQVNLLKGFEI